jgi:hypothetical protein
MIKTGHIALFQALLNDNIARVSGILDYYLFSWHIHS